MASNLDLARAIYADWSRGNFNATDWADPEIELVVAEGVGAGAWTGLDGMAESWRDFLDAWEGFRIEAVDYRELDGGRVLVLAQFSGRGRASGLEVGGVRSLGASVFRFRGGKVTELVLYVNADRALADLGLAADVERPGPPAAGPQPPESDRQPPS